MRPAVHNACLAPPRPACAQARASASPVRTEAPARARRQRLSDFVRDRRAGSPSVVAVLFTLLTLTGFALASDHAWLVYQRDLLKTASAAASLATSHTLRQSAGQEDLAVLAAIAERYVLANLPDGLRATVEESLTVEVTVDDSTGSAEVYASATISGALFGQWLWGEMVSHMKQGSGVERDENLIEVVLAVDISGSMDEYISGGTKIQAVKNAAREMVDILTAGGTTHSVAVGIVPWHYRVRLNQATRTRWEAGGWAVYPTRQFYPDISKEVGEQGAAQPSPPATLPPKTESWEGCVDQRSTAGNDPPGLTPVLPTAEPFTMGFYSPTPPHNFRNNRRLWSIAYHCPVLCHGLSTDAPTCPDFCYDRFSSSSQQSYVKEPQFDCDNDTLEILPLTRNLSTVENRIAALDGDGSSTYSALGMTWGHRLLAPTWRPFWGDAVHPIDLNQHPDAHKVLILLTDGLDNFLPESEANSHLQTACRKAKRDGVKVFTIAALESSNVASGSQLEYNLKDCSSQSDDPSGRYTFFHENVTAGELSATFQYIGWHLVRYRRAF